MKGITSFLIAAVTVGSANSQTHSDSSSIHHAPTVEQCRADGALWIKTDWHTLPMSKIWEMDREIEDCKTVDPIETSHQAGMNYFQIGNAILAEYTVRLMHFVGRHNLQSQFDAEDESGKR